MAKINHNIRERWFRPIKDGFGNQNAMNTELYDNKVDKGNERVNHKHKRE
jgi:hydrogenase maturation factor HypE